MLQRIWSLLLWLCHIGSLLSSWLRPAAIMDPRLELERRLRVLEERRPDWYALRFSQGRVYLALKDKVAELPFRRSQFQELVNDLDAYGEFLVPDVKLLRLVAESYGRRRGRWEPPRRLLELKERLAARENENVLELLRRLLQGMRADAQEDDFPAVDILDPSLLLIATNKAEPALAAELLMAGVDPAKPFTQYASNFSGSYFLAFCLMEMWLPFSGLRTACHLLERGEVAFKGSGIEENKHDIFKGCRLLLKKRNNGAYCYFCRFIHGIAIGSGAYGRKGNAGQVILGS